MSIIIQIMAILLARDLVWSKENPIEPLAHILKVKESSIEALSDFQGSSNGDVEKSVDSNSLSRSWVWFPTKQDLKTHYVCIRGWTSLWIGFRPLAYVSQIFTSRRVFKAKIRS